MHNQYDRHGFQENSHTFSIQDMKTKNPSAEIASPFQESPDVSDFTLVTKLLTCFIIIVIMVFENAATYLKLYNTPLRA